MKLSDCCWADYMRKEGGKTFCYACGCRCEIIEVTQKMVDHVENAREEAIRWGYKENDE